MRASISIAVLALVAGLGSTAARAADKAAIASAEAGCGPPAEHFKSRTMPSAGEIEPPPPGKVRVYVIAPEPLLWGGGLTLSVGVDGRWAGALRGRSQFSLALDTGQHHFCVRVEGLKAPRRGMPGDSTGLFSANLIAGQTIYLVTYLEGGPIDESTSLVIARIWQTNADEGKLLVSSAARSAMRKRR